MIPTTVNTWIRDNAAKLKQRLNSYNNLDEDAFQDAYLTLVQEYPTPESGSTFENAFIRAYRRLSNKAHSETYKQSHPDDVFFSLLTSDDETEPMEDTDEPKDHTPLAKRVQKHIRAAFPRRDVMIFEMRMQGFSCRDITDTLGVGTTAINNATERIITLTRLQFAAVAL